LAWLMVRLHTQLKEYSQQSFSLMVTGLWPQEISALKNKSMTLVIDKKLNL